VKGLWALGLGLACLVVLSSCGWVQVGIGREVTQSQSYNVNGDPILAAGLFVLACIVGTMMLGAGLGGGGRQQ